MLHGLFVLFCLLALYCGFEIAVAVMVLLFRLLFNVVGALLIVGVVIYFAVEYTLVRQILAGIIGFIIVVGIGYAIYEKAQKFFGKNSEDSLQF